MPCLALLRLLRMTNTPTRFRATTLVGSGQHEPPAIVRFAGSNAHFAYDEFFAGEENSHTERAYRHAVHRFLQHCETLGVALHEVTPGIVSDYLKKLQAQVKTRDSQPKQFRPASKPMKKLHLAGIRKFFDKLVERHAVVLNPALSVRGPKHSVSEGKTPAFTKEQVRRLLASIDASDIVGLRDRTIIEVLVYTAARAGAVAKLRRRDFFYDGSTYVFRFDEKGGRVRDIPVRHDLEGLIRHYLVAAGDAGDDFPLFRSLFRREKRFAPYVPADSATGRKERGGMTENDILRMVKRRLKVAGLPANRFTCHSFRATTATDLLAQGVDPWDVQALLGHADQRTTQLYDRRKRTVTRNIVERISI